jgi:hypothetical protein
MPSAMAEMLSALQERHGSARGFLRSLGVSPTVFDALEAELLEETPNR